MSFGEKIKKLRESKGLTQVELSKMIGTSSKTVSNYEAKDLRPRKMEVYQNFFPGHINKVMKFRFLCLFFFTYNGFAWNATRFSFSLSGIGSYIRKSRGSITYQPHFFCFFVGTGSCLYIFIIYFSKFAFCSCIPATYLRGSY